MGIFSGLLGNASEVDVDKIEGELEDILNDDEEVEIAFRVIRDYFVFSNRRLIFVDKQGASGKKIGYHSFPYKSITHFSVETAGHFDMDAELKIWITGTQMPIVKEFKKEKNIYEVQRALSYYVLK